MEELKKYLHPIRQSVSVTLILMLICGLIFPLVMNGLSMVLFPKQAAGSLIMVNGTAVGSEHVGQEFTEPYFMKCRPSAVHYNTYFEDAQGNKVYADGSEFSGLASGSQNFAASNPELVKRTEKDMNAFLAANPDIRREDIPVDLVTASGSGLDPHISPESASVQIPAVAEASGLSVQVIEEIVKEHTKGKLLGIFGEETVNVLKVNIDIAKVMGLLN